MLCYCIKATELHAKSNIGLVVTVTLHSLIVTHSRKRLRIDTVNSLEQMGCEPLESVQYIFLSNERHLAIDLCKFGLSVSPQVFISKALDQLKILVKAPDHKQLLKGLR